eukprot:6210274-Pleurochrysis_carterae.AAC.1
MRAKDCPTSGRPRLKDGRGVEGWPRRRRLTCRADSSSAHRRSMLFYAVSDFPRPSALHLHWRMTLSWRVEAARCRERRRR